MLKPTIEVEIVVRVLHPDNKQGDQLEEKRFTVQTAVDPGVRFEMARQNLKTLGNHAIGYTYELEGKEPPMSFPPRVGAPR